MGLMDDVQAITDRFAFCDPDSMLGVESIVYQPRGKSPQTINANIERNAQREEGGVISRELHVFVSAQDVPSVDVGGDVVTISHRRGENPRPHTVAEIISEDAGGFTLRLE